MVAVVNLSSTAWGRPTAGSAPRPEGASAGPSGQLSLGSSADRLQWAAPGNKMKLTFTSAPDRKNLHLYLLSAGPWL